METIKLFQPLLVNGEQRTEFQYDFNELDYTNFNRAFLEVARARGAKNAGTVSVMENDGQIHLHIGMALIVACNPGVDWNDVKRIKGMDQVVLAQVGRSFFMTAAASTPQSIYAPAIETTAKSSTPESKD